ncbi:alpha/beta fold hydrolase [Geopsychrobacter electrodiphilus]|uniref:alpha/beta fold hydrolase n=1 Tax=Geopsychrobacter electrodiphilus TaxID=225196 RepID=UPI000378D750|nr:alpha/beta fold hydrolase [Geopsychrobacter electrodiphilus]
MPEDLKTEQFEHGQLRWRELGEGAPLVLLHGWSMSHAVFTELAELLAPNFRLLIPDLPGHGGSDPVDPCSLFMMSKTLATWLNRLALGPVLLLGWSLGGQVAIQLSVDYPQLVERLLLMSSTPRFCASDNWAAGLPVNELRALRRGLVRHYLATMGEFFDLQFRGEAISPERRREILQFAVRPIGLPTPDAALLTLDILGREDLRDRLSSIQAPALVIHGQNDQIIPQSAGVYLTEHLPRASFISLSGIGHAPFLSRPGEIVRMIEEFCR